MFFFLLLEFQVETMSDEEREEKELDLTSPEVVTKYKSAAEIVNSMVFIISISSRSFIPFACIFMFLLIVFGFVVEDS